MSTRMIHRKKGGRAPTHPQGGKACVGNWEGAHQVTNNRGSFESPSSQSHLPGSRGHCSSTGSIRNLWERDINSLVSHPCRIRPTSKSFFTHFMLPERAAQFSSRTARHLRAYVGLSVWRHSDQAYATALIGFSLFPTSRHHSHFIIH